MKKNKWYGNTGLENQNDFQNIRINELSERFNRWHDKQLNLITFLINLFFTLSIVIIGFVLNDLSNNLFTKLVFDKFTVGKVAIIIFSISVLFGVLALFMRLYDFRGTKNKVKYKKLMFRVKHKLRYESQYEYSQQTIQCKIENVDKTIYYLGRLTMWFFYVQVSLFMLGLFIIVSCIW